MEFFEITKEDEGTAVHVHVEGPEDIFFLAVALRQIINNNRAVAAGLEAVRELARTCPEFDEVVNGNSVELPDFDKILKS